MSLPVLAALLTIVGFSINDTIVIFDRIRENRGRGFRKGETLADVINAAINQTLSRTILTSLTVFLVVAILYIFGGEVLRDFAFVLLVGVVTGTYSSVFVAAPIIVDWEAWSQRAAGEKAVAKKAVVKAGRPGGNCSVTRRPSGRFPGGGRSAPRRRPAGEPGPRTCGR